MGTLPTFGLNTATGELVACLRFMIVGKITLHELCSVIQMMDAHMNSLTSCLRLTGKGFFMTFKTIFDSDCLDYIENSKNGQRG